MPEVRLSIHMWSTAQYPLLSSEQLLLALQRVRFSSSKMPYTHLWHRYTFNLMDVVDLSAWLSPFWIAGHPTADEYSNLIALLLCTSLDHSRWQRMQMLILETEQVLLLYPIQKFLVIFVILWSSSTSQLYVLLAGLMCNIWELPHCLVNSCTTF